MTPSPRQVEVHSLEELDGYTATSTRLDGWIIQSVDLSGRAELLGRLDPRGAVFLGCPMPAALETLLRSRGALVFPGLPDLPFDPYRPRLYTAGDLYGQFEEGLGYASSPDARIYAWSRPRSSPVTLAHTLAAALHDHSVNEALDDATEHISRHTIVGVMGGHALARSDPGYADAVRLGMQLTRGDRTVLTGGGPGAMEAANLGAYLSPWPDAGPRALALLASATDYRADIDAWLGAAKAVQARWPLSEAGLSFSIPTWFYGHEPTNPFATAIAKLFTNALREDTLLHRCGGGIVFLPGQAGTVQEIFQTVTDSFYAVEGAAITAMVLVGRHYWSARYPVWPLLRQLAADRPMAKAVHLVETVDEAVGILLSRPAAESHR